MRVITRAHGSLHVWRPPVRGEYDFFNHFVDDSPKIQLEFLEIFIKKRYFREQTDLIKLIISSVKDVYVKTLIKA